MTDADNEELDTSRGGPCQTPLTDLLRSIPKDHRVVIEATEWPPSSHFIPVGRLMHEAAGELDALRARVAEIEQEAKQKREYFQHNHEVESNLNARAESAESQLRQVKADAAVAQVDPANEQIPYPHIVRLRELTEADVGSKLYAVAPEQQPFKCSMAGCDEPAIYQRPRDQPCVCKLHDPGR